MGKFSEKNVFFLHRKQFCFRMKLHIDFRSDTLQMGQKWPIIPGVGAFRVVLRRSHFPILCRGHLQTFTDIYGQRGQVPENTYCNV